MEKEKTSKAKETVVSNYKYKLVRKSDGLTKEGNEINYIIWKGNGTFQSLATSPMIGTSLALDLEFGVKSTHITDQITKILEVSEGLIKFETKDGIYECTVNKNNSPEVTDTVKKK